MRGSLGEKINQGGTADIHAWAPGQVVKLFKEGFPPRLGQQEARMTQAVFAAGVPAPEVFGEVTLDGPFGIVLGRLDGPTLLQVTRSGAVTFAQAGAILASLGLSVHRMSPPPEAFHLRGWMDTAFRLSGDIVPKHIASGILALIDRLQQPGDGLCHGDIHPENVIMTADGPRLIDWTFSIRAPAALEWVHSHQPDRVCPRRHRQSAAAACGQCGRAIRIRAAVRQAGSGAEASDGDLAADRDRPLLPAYGRADKRAMAADDAARRSGPAPAGLNPSSRARGRRCGCSVSASGHRRRFDRTTATSGLLR
jgi:Phosphotransferase enzyme family